MIGVGDKKNWVFDGSGLKLIYFDEVEGNKINDSVIVVKKNLW